jgi:hypothetical protein
VHDQLCAGEPRGARERELTRRGDVGADPLLAQEAEHCDVGERFRAVEDAPALAGGASQPPSLCAERLLAVDDERRPEALRELVGGETAEPQLAAFDTRGLREELEHGWILPGTVFSS